MTDGEMMYCDACKEVTFHFVLNHNLICSTCEKSEEQKNAITYGNQYPELFQKLKEQFS